MLNVLNDVTACDTYTLLTLTTGNYYTATNGSGTQLNAGDNITSTQTIYIYASNGTCSDESSFTATINAAPTVDVLNDVTACDTYMLPTLNVGNYYMATNGGGTPLNAGDNITTTQTIYIYASNGTCSDESSFTVTINATPTIDILNDVTACDSYTLPNLTTGNYYTATNGGGTALSAGDNITSTQTIYIYATNGTCSDESNFTVTINTTPTVDVLNDITACDSYTLPSLTTGNYYTATNGGGTALSAGDNITSTQTVYIYASNGTCSDESSFTVMINATPTVDVLNDVTACDSYTLPSLSTGDYYTATNGGGTPLNAGDNITSTQTIYIYASNGTCSNESSFTVTINTTPTVDVLNDVVTYNSFTLPILNIGDYYTDTMGNGTPLYTGDQITSSQIVYIYATNGGCYDESSFTITIHYRLDYPHFFTPNGDGHNDYWRITGGNIAPNTPIYIYDRYGKLLKIIRYGDIGWDGTYNNHNLPDDNYWFKVSMSDGRVGQGHFTLKRG